MATDAGSPKRNPRYRTAVGPAHNYDLIAAMTFGLLTTMGLREHHAVLDVGCGSLRNGRLLIPYLNPGNYTGIEPNRTLIDEGIASEVGDDLIRIKRPRLICAADAGPLPADARFDFIFAQSILSHTGVDLLVNWLRDASRHLKDDGVFLATYFPGETDNVENGWVAPGYYTYRPDTMKRLAREAGLHFDHLDWRHPAQQWTLMHKDGYDAGWLHRGEPLSWNLMARAMWVGKKHGSEQSQG